MKINIIWLMIILLISFTCGGAWGSYISYRANIEPKCIHQHNKDLMMLNEIFQSKKPIYRFYENGWCLSYEPCGYKEVKNKR